MFVFRLGTILISWSLVSTGGGGGGSMIAGGGAFLVFPHSSAVRFTPEPRDCVFTDRNSASRCSWRSFSCSTAASCLCVSKACSETTILARSWSSLEEVALGAAGGGKGGLAGTAAGIGCGTAGAGAGRAGAAATGTGKGAEADGGGTGGGFEAGGGGAPGGGGRGGGGRGAGGGAKDPWPGRGAGGGAKDPWTGREGGGRGCCPSAWLLPSA
mmetsp:Transcript_12679/g.24398  ORF Transcript_12679/g.24398 Transcript_12679/m.24398 type:complete len:213 (-) Transcript_12679:2410-3048(-)